MPSSRALARTWEAKASFNSTRSIWSRLRLGGGKRAGDRRNRADAHICGVDTGDAAGDDPSKRLGAEPAGALLGADQQAGGAVVEGRGVAGGDGAPLAEDRAQLRQLLQRGVGAGPLVGLDEDGFAALRGLDRDDLLGQPAGLGGGDGALVAAQGEGVLVLAADPVALGDVLAGLAHRFRRDAELRHARVDHAPAKRRVVHRLRPTGEGSLRLLDHPGSPAHRLDPAGEIEIPLA